MWKSSVSAALTLLPTICAAACELIPTCNLWPQDSYLILDTLPAEYDSRVKAMEVDEKPSEDYSDVGGLDKQIQELVEAIVLPVTHKARLLGSGSGFWAGVRELLPVQELVEAIVLPVTHKAGLRGSGSGCRAGVRKLLPVQELVEAIVLPVTHKARLPGSGCRAGFRV